MQRLVAVVEVKEVYGNHSVRHSVYSDKLIERKVMYEYSNYKFSEVVTEKHTHIPKLINVNLA